MKTLYLIRHGKAGDHTGNDFERGLVSRGVEDNVYMGKVLVSRAISFNLIITSSAVRTYATARTIALAVNYPEEDIIREHKLYNAKDKTMLNILMEVDDKYDIVCLVGHNPGITEFANNIFSSMIPTLPTSGVVGGPLAVNHWKETRWHCGSQEFYEAP